ncbi:MAG TPA: ATP synthase F1 subunit delta [Ktedonobacterales bacterium]|nr:ATP synthase F1 subunit delta [Ktedonobacterales bacterium]
MLKGAVARRYAEAVFELGVEPDTLDSWLTDVRLIAEYFSNRQLAFILGEPNVRFERKEAIVRDLLADKVRPEGLGLALALVESGIVALAPRVRDEFERLYNERRGQAVADVTSAMPLDDAMRASITRQMEQVTGKRIILREKVDSALLGGAIVRVGDTLIDGSVRRRLELLRRRIAEGGDLGGAMDGLDDLLPPGGSSDGAAANGPASSTSAAPRDPRGPHLGPRLPENGQGAGRGHTRMGGKRGKGRRR